MDEEQAGCWGGFCMCQGQVQWKKKRRSRQLSNRALLSSLLSVSVFCSPLCPGAFSDLPGSVVARASWMKRFERHYNWRDWSWSAKAAMHQQFMRCESQVRPRKQSERISRLYVTFLQK